MSIVVATTALNLSTCLRARQNSGGYRKDPEEKVVTPPTLLQQKFNEAWKKQEDRLSKLKTTKHVYGTELGFQSVEKTYENGVIAEQHGAYAGEIKRNDNMGNLIYHRTYILDKHPGRFVYYPDSKQKEFEWTKEKGIRHFTPEGKEDTKSYYAKLKIELKRSQEEKKSGVTFKKMSKIEKAVAYVLQDTKKMTLLEKMLARKVKNR